MSKHDSSDFHKKKELHIDDISTEDLSGVLDVLHKYHGYDFKGYAKSSLKRSLIRFMAKKNIKSVFDLKHYLVNEPEALEDFLHKITVNVTEMFRDPGFFRKLKTEVFPVLSTYPSIKIWHAGCSTGEEVYSLAILLHEAGLLNRTQIYATDINTAVLEKAMQGIYPLAYMKDYTQNYLQSGGTEDFSKYYTARYDNVKFSEQLRKHIVFSHHNLVSDGSFNEFNLILCRNVLIYFDRSLQNRAIKLFTESLCTFGFLALGSKESMLFTDDVNKYHVISNTEKIYKRNF